MATRQNLNSLVDPDANFRTTVVFVFVFVFEDVATTKTTTYDRLLAALSNLLGPWPNMLQTCSGIPIANTFDTCRRYVTDLLELALLLLLTHTEKSRRWRRKREREKYFHGSLAKKKKKKKNNMKKKNKTMVEQAKRYSRTFNADRIDKHRSNTFSFLFKIGSDRTTLCTFSHLFIFTARDTYFDIIDRRTYSMYGHLLLRYREGSFFFFFSIFFLLLFFFSFVFLFNDKSLKGNHRFHLWIVLESVFHRYFFL